MEAEFPESMEKALRARGHDVERGWYDTPSLGHETKLRKHMGLVNAIGIDPQSGDRLGAADPRDDRRRVWDTNRRKLIQAATARGNSNEIMQRLLSTYMFVSRKLTPELLGLIAGAGFQASKFFCTRSHFEYANETRGARDDRCA